MTWVGGSGDWNTLTNWSTGRLPEAEDDVVIDVPGEISVTHTDAHTVKSLLCQEAFILSGTLTVSSTIQVNNELTLASGTLIGASILRATTGQPVVVVASGTLDAVTLRGEVVVPNGQTLRIANGLTLSEGARITLKSERFSTPTTLSFASGIQTLQGEGEIVLGGSAWANYLEPGWDATETALTIGPQITVRGHGQLEGFSVLLNRGTIQADVHDSGLDIWVDGFTNEGTLRAVNGATLKLNSSRVNSNSWSNSGTIAVEAATLSFGGEWTNTGTITANASTVNLGGNITQAGLGTFNRTDGTVALTGTLSGGLTLDATTGGWTVIGTLRGGTITATDGAELTASGGTLDGVSLKGKVIIPNEQNLTITNGLTLSGGAKITFSSEGRATLYFASGIQTLGGEGEIDMDGSTWANNYIYLGSEGETTLTIGPRVMVRGHGYLGEIGSSTLLNQGTIQADGSAGSLSIGLKSFTNEGALHTLNGSSLNLDSRIWSNRGTIAAEAATLSLGGEWTNAGTITANASHVNLGGNVTQKELGTFNRTDGTVALTGTWSGGLELDATTGSWTVAGTILRGTINATGGAELIANGGTLDGVTLKGEVMIPDGRSLRIANGLTFSGGARIKLSPKFLSLDTSLSFAAGSQTLGGKGEIVMGGNERASIYLGNEGETALTIGPQVTIRGHGGLGQGPRSSPSTLLNQGTIQADVIGSGLSIFVDSFTNEGALNAFNKSGLWVDAENAASTGTLRSSAGSTVAYRGSATFDGNSIFASQPSGSVSLSGHLLGGTQSPISFSPQGTTQFDGSGNELSPQYLEVMSLDVGTNATAFTGSFAYGMLALDNGTYVRLVDKSDNSPGSGPEALYVNSLLVPTGCTLDLNGLHLYTRASQVRGRITGGSIHQIFDGGPIRFDKPISSELALPGELDQWTFFGRAGQTYAVAVDTGSDNVLAPKLGHGEVQLLDPTGALVARGSNTVAGQIVTLTDMQLQTDGTYRIYVRARADQSSATGHYQITLWEITPDTAPLVLNQTANGRIESPYSLDRWTFSAVARQQVQLKLINASAPGVAFTLRGPGGEILFDKLVNDSGLVNLPADGSYTLTAAGTDGAYNIAYAFKLNETTQTLLAIGDTFAGQFAGGGQSQLFLVSVTNSGPLRITLAGGAVDNRTELYVTRGAPPTRGNFDVSSVRGPGANRDLLFPSAPVGTYYVLVYGDHIPSPGPFTLQVTSAGLYLTDIAPNRHANNGSFAMSLSGAGFETGTAVELLTDGGVPAGSATNVSVDSFTQLTATFPINAAPPGFYSVRLRQPDGDSAILTNAFEVLAAGEPKLNTHLILPGALGRHGLATLYIEYENAGTVSMPAPLIQLRSTDRSDSDKPILTLVPTRLSSGFWTSVLPQGFGHSVTLLASGSHPGLLQPGERVSVPVYYAGLLQPWDFSDDKVELGLSTVEVGNQQPMNWTGATYARGRMCVAANELSNILGISDPIMWINGRPPSNDDLLARIFPLWEGLPCGRIEDRWDEPGVLQLRPESIDEEVAWSGIVANLRASVGETLGDWVRTLGENAQYLARHGQSSSNIDDLWRFEVLKASGLGPVPILESVTDASMVTPGVGLSLSRSFPSAIPGHYVQGPFGFGWTFSWNLKLTQETNGLVQIGSCCGGTQRRRYEPDVRTPGKYFSMPGDTASLRKLGGGIFELRDPNGTVTRFAASGLLEAVEDPNGNRVTAAYDGGGNLQTLTHSSGASLTLTYNAAGRISLIHDSAGRTNTFSYDASGNYLTAVTTSDGKITRYSYQTTGDARVRNALTSIERGGTTQQFTYDDRGRLQSTSRTNGEKLIEFGYDPDGTVSVTDHLGTTHLFYNESGLLTKVVDPLGHITTSEFDTDFRLKRLVLPTGENQAFAWSGSGNLLQLTDELGYSTKFAYDPAFNRLASFTDAKANTTRYTYDARGNLLSTIYPNQSAERFGDYTAAGLPLTYANRRGQPLTHGFNSAGQITNQIFADGHSIQFTYDARGNLSSTVDGEKVTTYAYAPDTDGDRLKRVTYPNGRFLDYNYDSFGRRIQMTDQDGFATKYEYDSAGRLWTLRDETDTLLVTYSYDSTGRLSRVDKGNGTFTTYEYDAAGQLLSLQNHRNATTLNSRFDYTYDRRGRRTGMNTLDGDWTYGYDATGQLTRAVFDSTNPQIPDQDLTYEYDALGNRVRTIENGVTNAYVANNLNQYTSVAGTNHQYDADGNLTFDGVNTYEWDQQSRLVRVTGPSGIGEYEYSAFGNRDAIIRDGQRTDYLSDPTGLIDVIGEFPQGGSPRANHVHGLGLVSRSEGAARNFYDYDGIGTAVALTGDAGNTLNRYAWEPFGKNISSSETISNPFQFVGEFGVSTGVGGIISMRSRDYLASLGRFLSDDLIGLSGADANLRRYAYNNPIALIDPIGQTAYTYNQTTGEFTTGARASMPGFANTVGYSGTGGGRNNPYAQHSPDFGPTPVGTYTVGPPVKNRLGNPSYQLTPTPETRRNFPPNRNPDSFWIHANNAANDASTGCIIIDNAEIRRQLREGDTVTVVPGFPPNDDIISEIANAQDPNEKRGPMGFGTANFLAPGASLPYRIKFENFGPGSLGANGAPLPSEVWASAPAQEVMITDQLSTNLNWATLQFTGFGFGDTLQAINPPRSFFQTALPATIQNKSFEVQLEASLDLSTGRIRAVFRSIDPLTSLPPDVLTGFLPPEDGTGVGRGFIEYIIEPRAGLPTGTQIRNVALISFDRQPSIATDQIDPLDPAAGTDPAKQALITIDDDSPTSAVLALPPVVTEETFPVSWSGSDGGAGVADFDVFVSVNGAPWALWLGPTTNNTAPFLGRNRDTYAFYSIARDPLGHNEAPPTSADTVTVVQLSTSFALSVEFIEANPAEPFIKLTYPVEAAFDYRVEFRNPLDGEAAWQSLPDNPHNSGSVTIPASEESRYFRVQRAQR